MARQRVPVEKRFWSRVKKTPTCWLWQGKRRRYGIIYLGPDIGRSVGAHRFAYELLVGPIPDGLQIRHSCRNPLCVNPAHLSVGTAKDNAKDREDHGYTQKGEGHYRAKLTEKDVQKIRRRHARESITFEALAREYGLDASSVGDIVKRNTWKHLPPGPGEQAPKESYTCRGESHCDSRLTETKVREIRRLYATGKRSQLSISKEFGIAQQTLSAIVRRRTWKHVE